MQADTITTTLEVLHPDGATTEVERKIDYVVEKEHERLIQSIKRKRKLPRIAAKAIARETRQQFTATSGSVGGQRVDFRPMPDDVEAKTFRVRDGLGPQATVHGWVE
ncbi:hypothetical protein [Salinibacter ruber]|uniref:Uncharacterized protein n=1 Tax=Salinibacter ruber (strain DSM 13855 / M31) TaxID=309807 RepID=Q2RYJ3_SALRD|nr:hypothetical protein [Salinibacter ruber]ABC46379.1 hypothetical protein SRU_p0030 [Salinibacter ruber DSM 13855]